MRHGSPAVGRWRHAETAARVTAAHTTAPMRDAPSVTGPSPSRLFRRFAPMDMRPFRVVSSRWIVIPEGRAGRAPPLRRAGTMKAEFADRVKEYSVCGHGSWAQRVWCVGGGRAHRDRHHGLGGALSKPR